MVPNTWLKKGGNRTKEVPLKQCFFYRKQFTISRKTNTQRSAILALRGRILIETLNLRRNTFDPLPHIFLSYILALIALKMSSVYLQKENKKRSCFSLSTLLVLLLQQQKILQVKPIWWKSLTWLVTLDKPRGTCRVLKQIQTYVPVYLAFLNSCCPNFS